MAAHGTKSLGMLLQAIPENLRSDLVASRRLTVDQILFKLLVTYRPGGASERSKVLTSITEGRCGDSPGEVLEWVRNWRRNITRANELGITIPDAMVLMGALQRSHDMLSMKSPQVAYRLNTIRQQLGVDRQPVFGAVWSFSEHLQAEAEELMISGSVVVGDGGPQKGSNPKPVVKSLQNVGSTAPQKGQDGSRDPPKSSALASNVNAGSVTSKHACRFWGKDEGCKHADKCRFVHAMLNPKDGRCFLCSALGHSKKDCPNAGGGKNAKVAKTKTKDSPPKNKGDEGKKEVRVQDEVSKSSIPAPAGGLSDCSEDVGSKKGLDMIDSVHTLMKSLTPHVKMINMKKSNVNELKTGLLDGGATNALRVGTAQELADAVPVQVELAAGTAQLFQDPNTGTLLTKEAVEPIVPLRGLINLGYRIQWDTNGCVIEHGKHGRIKCWLRNGCPVVLENHALLLIDEIEGYERFQRLGPKIAMGQVTEEVMEW